MAEDLPKPLARARARIEAGRAGAELWFNKQVKKDKTAKDFDETLLGYVFHVFFVFAGELYNASLELDWPTDEVRKRIEQGLESVINEAFNSKHYYRGAVGGHLWKAGFHTRATDAIRSSDEWREIQEKLKELAEWQAECVAEAPSLIGRLPKEALVRIEAAAEAAVAGNDGGGSIERTPTMSDIRVALDEGNRKLAVRLRCKMDNCSIKALRAEAFLSHRAAEKTKVTAFDRWQATRPDTPAWAGPLIVTRLLR